jgi:hypothetical protein
MRIGVAEHGLLGPEPLVFVIVGELGRLDLVELEAQEVPLALAGGRVATQPLELLVGGSPGASRRLEGAQIDPGEAIEGPSLACGGEQPHVGVLAVEVDEAGGQLRELRGGDQATIAIGAGSPRAGHDPGEDHLVAVDDEAPLDRGLVGSGSHDGRIGSVAGQQPDGSHQHRLAGSGLPGQSRHPGVEEERDLVDHSEVAYGQLSEHGRRTRADEAIGSGWAGGSRA